MSQTTYIKMTEGCNLEPARVVDWKLFEAGTGTPGFEIEFAFENVQGPRNEEVRIKAQLWLTDNALDGTLRTLKEALGWNGDSITELDRTEPDAHDFEGKRVLLTVEMEPGFKDPTKKYPKVKWINNPDYASMTKPIGKEKLSDLHQKLNDRIMIFRSKQENKLLF